MPGLKAYPYHPSLTHTPTLYYENPHTGFNGRMAFLCPKFS